MGEFLKLLAGVLITATGGFFTDKIKNGAINAIDNHNNNNNKKK